MGHQVPAIRLISCVSLWHSLALSDSNGGSHKAQLPGMDTSQMPCGLFACSSLDERPWQGPGACSVTMLSTVGLPLPASLGQGLRQEGHWKTLCSRSQHLGRFPK